MSVAIQAVDSLFSELFKYEHLSNEVHLGPQARHTVQCSVVSLGLDWITSPKLLSSSSLKVYAAITLTCL